MKEVFKALAVTLLTLGPAVIQHVTGPGVPFWIAFAIYGLAVFTGYWKVVFKPDTRFLDVRTPTLDDFFSTTFEEFNPEDGSRFPFRVYIYQPKYFWPFTRLHVVYSWKSNPSDADHGKSWWCWRGLCGKVYRSGMVEFYRKGQDLTEYRMRPSDVQETERVLAIFCYPLRKPSKTVHQRVSRKVTAVVSIDSLVPAGAEQLAAWYNDYENNGLQVFVEKASWLSLYF